MELQEEGYFGCRVKYACNRERAELMKCIYRPLVGRGPGQEALSKGGVQLPPGREGGSGAISKGFVSPGRRDTAASPASVPTETGGVLSKKRTGSQKPRRCQHPCP